MGCDTQQAPSAGLVGCFVKVVNLTAQELRSLLDMLYTDPDAGVVVKD